MATAKHVAKKMRLLTGRQDQPKSSGMVMQRTNREVHHPSEAQELEKDQPEEIEGVKMADVEKIYTIPLRDVKALPRTKRAPRVHRGHQDLHCTAHEDETGQDWIDTHVNEAIWARGRERPPEQDTRKGGQVPRTRT